MAELHPTVRSGSETVLAYLETYWAVTGDVPTFLLAFEQAGNTPLVVVSLLSYDEAVEWAARYALAGDQRGDRACHWIWAGAIAGANKSLLSRRTALDIAREIRERADAMCRQAQVEG